MATTRPASDGAGVIPASSFDLGKDPGDDFAAQFGRLVTCRAGVIEVAEGRPFAARPRLWARRPSQLEAWLWGARTHRRLPGDHCWLYFHQPRRFSNFLVVSYVLSTRQTSLATIRVALALLDLLAERKRTDALLGDVASARISDRALARWGWEPLAPSRWHRRHIKRFYGQYDVDESLLAPNCAAPDAGNSQLALSR
jgi:hypothetical protein